MCVDIDEPYRAIEFRKVNGRWDYGSGPGVTFRSTTPGPGDRDAPQPGPWSFRRTGYYDLAPRWGPNTPSPMRISLPNA